MPTGVYDDEDQRVLNQERSPDPGQAHYNKTFGAPSSLQDTVKDGQHQAKSKKSEASGSSSESGRFAKVKKQFSDFKEKRGKLLKNKWLIGGAVGGGALAGLLILLLVLMSAFKIPHLVENITEYQFARVAGRFQIQNQRAITTKLAAATATAGDRAKMESRYGKYLKVPDSWSPAKQINMLQTQGYMKFDPPYGDGKQIKTVTLRDGTVLKPQPTFIRGFIPGFTFGTNVNFTNKFVSEFQTAMRAEQKGAYTRWRAGREIRKTLNISLVAWKAGQYTGKSQKEIRLDVEKRTSEKVARVTPSTSSMESDKKAIKDLEQARQNTLNDPEKLDKAIQNGGVSDEAKSIMANVREGSAFQSGLAAVNDAYAIAAPICIVYEGSMSKSGETINNNMASQITAAQNLATVSDQQKEGTTMDPAIGKAYSDKLGNNLGASNAIQRSSGKNVDTIANSSSPQASASGSFTLFDATLGGPNTLTDAVEGAMGPVCEVLLDTKVAVALAGVSAGAVVLSGGGVKAVSKSASTAVAKVAKGLATKGARREALSTVGSGVSKTATLLGTVVKSSAKIAATTIAAKWLVANQSGELNNGLEQGNEYADQVDSGMNLMSNELSRQQQFGRPLTAEETRVAIVKDVESVAKANKEKSAYQRYFALSNPQSLLSHFGYTASATTQKLGISSLASTIRHTVNFGTAASKISASVNPKLSADTLNANSFTYGNIQWAWSEDELEKLKSDPTYNYYENNALLDESGNRQAVADKYGDCFSSEVGQGTLLQDGKILLDDNGNVVDTPGALCSRSNLSYDNNEFGSEMVFRWRVAMSDDRDFEEKIYQSEETNPSPASGAVVGTGGQFRAATFNIFHAKPGQPHAEWTARLTRSVDVIKGTSELYKGGTEEENAIDIIGMQEVRQKQIDALKTDKYLGTTNWGFFPSSSSRNAGIESFQPDIIVWNKTKFKEVPGSKGFIKGARYFGGSPLTVPKIKLQDAVTGSQVWVVNTHDPSNQRNAGLHSRIRMENAKIYRDTFAEMKKDGIPIIFTGDFNNRYTPGGAGNTPPGGPETLTYCIVSEEKSGMQDAYDAFMNTKKQTCPRSDGGNFNGPDHIFVSKTLQVTNLTKARAGKVSGNGSDVHPTIIADISFPGADVSATSGDSASAAGWQWPVSLDDYPGTLSSCFQDPGHTGIDIPVPTGTPVYAARGGQVVLAKSSGDAGNAIIIYHEEKSYSNYQHNSELKVKVGDRVEAGDLIAYSGNTGYSKGPHVHFAVTNQNGLDSRKVVAYSINPLNFLPKDRKTGKCS